MYALTILKYLLGHAGAIRLIAAHPFAVPVGIVLVGMAGAARNYDQKLMNGPAWFLNPLAFSILSGAWLLVFIGSIWKNVRIEPPDQPRTADAPERDCDSNATPARAAASFFGLFWMTAPLAWLYAIPVERFCAPVEAAQWNVRLLAVVAAWRVLLMSRVVSVLGRMCWWKSLARVLLPASIETLVLAGSVFVAGFGRVVVAGMAGLRNSPAEEVLTGALGIAQVLAVTGFLVSVLLLFLPPRHPVPASNARLPSTRPLRLPWILLTIAGLLWWQASRTPQRELALTAEARRLAGTSDWSGLTAFLSQHPREAFAPAVVLPPSPYEFDEAAALPDAYAALTDQSAPWVRQMITESLEMVLEQEDAVMHVITPDGLMKILNDAERQPGGADLVARHEPLFRQLATCPDKPETERARVQERLQSLIARAGREKIGYHAPPDE